MAERAADVVVVGGGGAGLAAAVAAAEAGASVLLLQQGTALGGKTALAMGSLTAAESRLQQQRGIADTKSASRADILRFINARGRALEPDDPSLDVVVEDGAALIDWFAGLGVAFTGPHPERPHQQYRLHCAVPDGSAYVRALTDALGRLGGRVRIGCAPSGLAPREDGLEITLADGGTLHADAMVLAAGDYSAAVERFRPHGAPPAEPLRPWARGDGQHLARALGADLRGMDRPIAPALRFRDPPYTEPDADLYRQGAILVDARGERLDRDGAPHGTTPAVVAAEQAWTVFGGELVERLARAEDDSPHARDGWRRTGRLFICTAPARGYDYLADTLARPGCGQADTPEALGRTVGIDPAGLAATLAAVSAARTANNPPLPIARPPYVALGSLRARLVLTDGGIRVDARLRALRADGTPMPRLFAAGNAARSVGWMGAHGYSLCWAFASGRRAGRSAAAFARGETD